MNFRSRVCVLICPSLFPSFASFWPRILIFNSYVKLPEGRFSLKIRHGYCIGSLDLVTKHTLSWARNLDGDRSKSQVSTTQAWAAVRVPLCYEFFLYDGNMMGI